LTQQMMCISWF